MYKVPECTEYQSTRMKSVPECNSGQSWLYPRVPSEESDTRVPDMEEMDLQVEILWKELQTGENQNRKVTAQSVKS